MTEHNEIHFPEIEKRILAISEFVKQVVVTKRDNELTAFIYPDFDRLEKANVINIEEELKWYAVELYNIEAEQGKRVTNYKILTHPFREQPETVSTNTEIEPDNAIYRELKKYLGSVTASPIFPASHLELDLGLDSLEYVMLFMFIEKSYALHLDEEQFSKLMVLEDLYLWIEKHYKKSDISSVNWHDILKEKSKEILVYSPWVMMVWKWTLLPFLKLYLKLKVTGIENLPSSPFIIAPTHHSMLDGFVVLATLPSSVLKKSFFLAYEGEFGTPRLRPVAKYSQMLLIDVDKNIKASLQRTALPLIESQNLVIFPEGARSRDGKLLEFKKFFAILSEELNVPIVPVVMKGTFEAMPTGRIFPKREKISIKYLEPIYPDDESYNKLSDRVRDSIREELKKA